jgi:hypothetical protein
MYRSQPAQIWDPDDQALIADFTANKDNTCILTDQKLIERLLKDGYAEINLDSPGQPGLLPEKPPRVSFVPVVGAELSMVDSGVKPEEGDMAI